MKANFKPLGLAAAVAAVSAGYAGSTMGLPTATNTGDVAIVPYYTVENGFNSGVHIINTTNAAQVVKLRLRRGSDSQDSLDFNIVLSPQDEWVGSIQRDDDDRIFIQTADTSCTAPAATDGKFFMPDTGSDTTVVNFREGADEGYIEIIGMAQVKDPNQPIYISSKHKAGVPADCVDVRQNFFRFAGTEKQRGTDPSVRGVHLPAVTSNGKAVSLYVDTPDNALSVSYFSRDSDGGLEFGGNAVHLNGFALGPMMTNQEVIVAGASDPLGYLFPDLDGGSPGFNVAGIGPGTDNRGRFDAVVRPSLGVQGLLNDWSTNTSADFEVTTDWVVTLPGQYLMLDPGSYIASLLDAKATCAANVCDFRDLPVGLSITYYDREEGRFTPESGDLVVSPAINVAPSGAVLNNEVNVIEWSNGSNDPVLGSSYAVSFQPTGLTSQVGWADLAVTATATKTQSVWNYLDPNNPDPVVNAAVPIIGFAAWQRNFGDNAAANYGRAVDHAYRS